MDAHDVDAQNLFRQAALLQLETSVWTAQHKLDPRRINRTSAREEWLRAHKKLVNPEALKPLTTIVSQARHYLRSIALPFPVEGMTLAPKESIAAIDSSLTDLKARFDGAVQAFAGEYPELRTTAQSFLGELFDETDYPVDILAKFGFAWRFLVLQVPDGSYGLLTPKIYEREKRKFLETIEETRRLSVSALREEFARLVGHLTDRFLANDGNPKVFRDTTLTNFYDFFETWKTRNLFQGAELAGLVERAQEILAGREPQDFRDDAGLKAHVARQMGRIDQELEALLPRARRKVILPPTAQAA